MEEISIKQIFLLLAKHIWKITAISIICAIAGYFLSYYLLTEKYESSTTMYISSNKNSSEGNELTYNEYNLNLKLVNSYRELCKSNRILNLVLDETRLNIQLEDLSKLITVSSVNNTEIIEITVTSPNAKTSAQLANVTAEIFISEIPNIIKMDNVQIIDYATVSEEPVSPNVFLNTLFAFLIGLVLSILIIFMIDYFDISIKEKEQLEEVLNAPVFGVIPKIGSNIISIADNKHVSAPVAKEAFLRLATNIGFLNIADQESVSIAVTSSSMGEGKSTVISNLGVSMAKNNKRVLLIDADMRKPTIHKFFKLTNKAGLSTVLSSNNSWKHSVLTTDFENLDVIVAGIQPPNPVMLLSTHKLKKIIDEAKHFYDYVLIDTPPALVVSDVLALSLDVDHILMVTAYKQVKVPQIQRVKKDFEQIGKALSGSILNFYNFTSSKKDFGYYNYYDKKREKKSRKARNRKKVKNTSESHEYA